MAFEDIIRKLTSPRAGAYPRPWMTKTCPDEAQILIVGASSATTFRCSDVGPHDQYMDALWNRNGRSCYELYNTVANSPSKTRPNLDQLSRLLTERGMTSMQTNVSCASARYDTELSREDRAHGTEIFKAIVEHVRWRTMIIHGVGACKRVGRVLDIAMLPVPKPDAMPVQIRFQEKSIFISPTLAPPGYRSSVWAYLKRVVQEIA